MVAEIGVLRGMCTEVSSIQRDAEVCLLVKAVFTSTKVALRRVG